MPGRPKKARRKEWHKEKGGTSTILSKKGVKMKCGNCGMEGHDKRSSSQVKPKKKKTRMGGGYYVDPITGNEYLNPHGAMKDALLNKLTSGNSEEQRFAAGEIRFIAKQNDHNCMAIGEAGAIPLLVGILTTPDLHTQEYAFTALLNLSICNQRGKKDAAVAILNLCICQGNKGKAVRAGIVPTLMKLLTEPHNRMDGG
ncbi:hypothetical protein POM88_051562 [Heracleum sosnowskyi]|uniref:Beta-catenin n=1 Tax=Heracleum sosnowskyi TaxID=360622 RepID=A0AAD8M2I5_9APIA|nr:hypothetical protein POM88_051562 [Heracleum sosnowskyi]